MEDDGKGIPPPERRDFGMGLEIMAHRAGSMGASLQSKRCRPRRDARACRWASLASRLTFHGASRIRIFVVDDHPMVQEWLSTFLRTQPTWRSAATPPELK